MMKRVMTTTFTKAPVSISISTGPWGILRSDFAIATRINPFARVVNIKAGAGGLICDFNANTITR